MPCHASRAVTSHIRATWRRDSVCRADDLPHAWDRVPGHYGSWRHELAHRPGPGAPGHHHAPTPSPPPPQRACLPGIGGLLGRAGRGFRAVVVGRVGHHLRLGDRRVVAIRFNRRAAWLWGALAGGLRRLRRLRGWVLGRLLVGERWIADRRGGRVVGLLLCAPRSSSCGAQLGKPGAGSVPRAGRAWIASWPRSNATTGVSEPMGPASACVRRTVAVR